MKRPREKRVGITISVDEEESVLMAALIAEKNRR